MQAETTKKRLSADERRIRDNMAEAEALVKKNVEARDKVAKALAEAKNLIVTNARKIKLLRDFIIECGGTPSDAIVDEIDTAANDEKTLLPEIKTAAD